MRLENRHDILDRALTTLHRNPQILESLVNTVGDAVGEIGQLGEKALGPGGGLTKTLDDVGQAAQQAVQPGGAASQALGGLTDAAGRALGPGGAVGQLGQVVGQGVSQLGQGLGQVVYGADQAVGQAGQQVGGDVREAGQAAGQATSLAEVGGSRRECTRAGRPHSPGASDQAW